MSGEAAPANDYSHCKKFVSYIEMRALLVQTVPVAPCLLHASPCEERASILSVAFC